MTTKYRSKNALTTWWEQASRNARIGAAIAGGLACLLLLIGIGFGLKSVFTVDQKDEARVDTTIKLPEKGVEASDIPSTFATPEIPPLVLPTPTNTPEPSPSATVDDFSSEGSGFGGSGYSSESGYGNDSGGFPNQGGAFPNQNTPNQYDALAAQIRPLCGVTEISTSSTGTPLLRSYQQWGKGEFASFLPCLDAMVTIPKDAGIDIEVMVKDQEADAGYLMLRAQDVRQLGLEDKSTREQRLRKLFQVSPGRQLK